MKDTDKHAKILLLAPTTTRQGQLYNFIGSSSSRPGIWNRTHGRWIHNLYMLKKKSTQCFHVSLPAGFEHQHSALLNKSEMNLYQYRDWQFLERFLASYPNSEGNINELVMTVNERLCLLVCITIILLPCVTNSIHFNSPLKENNATAHLKRVNIIYCGLEGQCRHGTQSAIVNSTAK